MIITFYSFKGGVGRTLALANVGVALAQADHRVLVIDFDLEAPGLTRYLENVFGGDLQHSEGLLELLERQREEGDAAALLQEHTVEVLRTPGGGVLDLLTSGVQDASYPARILGFDWSKFFGDADGGAFFEHCRSQWMRNYEFVLIDSRTGITDSGGVCTIQLPDILVPVFTASRQSVEGVIDVMRRAQEGRQLLAYDRAPAAVVPLPSRFDSRTEFALSQRWLDEFTEKFSEFYASWLPKDTTVRQVLERTKLPYVAFFSFGERLPVFEETGSDPESLSYALRTFARLLESNLADTSRILAPTGATTRTGVTADVTPAARVGEAGPDSPASAASGTEPPVAEVRRPPLLTGARSRTAVIAAAAVIAAIGVTALFSSGRFPSPVIPTVSPTAAPTLAPAPTTSVLAGHTNTVTSVAFGPNGRVLASGSADSTVRLWNAADPATPVPIGTPLTAHTAAVNAVAFSSDGSILATGSSDKSVKLWDVSNPTAPRPFGTALTGPAAINSVAFSSDSRFLASASNDSTITVWEVASGRAVDTLRGHNGPVRSVSFAQSGYVLASGGDDRTARLWDLSRQLSARPALGPQEVTPAPTRPPSAPATNAELSGMRRFAKGSTVAVDRIRLIEIGDPTPTPDPITLTGFNDAVVSVAFGPDGRTLATGSGLTVSMWDISDPTRPRQVGAPIAGHYAFVTAVAFSPNGRTLASSSADNTVLLWDVTDPAHPTRLGQPLTGASASITCVAFSANGRSVAGGSADLSLLLWRPFG
jgi:WD40 repeat protein/MinD-like ATPase involved in chromosome partitioning or flagellar assembly